MKWFFCKTGRTIEMRARAESDDGAIGDAFCRMSWGDPPFYGVTFGKLVRARAGVIEVNDDGVGRIVEAAP